MTSFTGRRSSTATALLLAAACVSASLTGCSIHSKLTDDARNGGDTGLMGFIEDRPFTEGETVLPPLPEDADLIPFPVNGKTPFVFAVDSKSLSVGKDNVVRYTVVIRSQSGARNVSFEGMRCDAFQRKLYATLPPGATEWEPNRIDGGVKWLRMDSTSSNNYAGTLATEYFCDGHTVAGTVPQLIRALRDQAPSQLYR